MTKVISLRVSYHDLAACYDLLSIGNPSIKGAPLGSVVSRVLHDLLGQFRTSNAIPTYATDYKAQAALRAYLPPSKKLEDLTKEVDEFPLTIPISPTSPTFASPAAKLSALMSPTLQTAEREIEDEKMEGIFKAPVHKELIKTTSSTQASSETPPWKGVNKLAWQQIIKISPRDKTLLTAQETNDPLLLKAVELAYYQFRTTPEKWSGIECQALVLQLHKKFLDWQAKKDLTAE